MTQPIPHYTDQEAWATQANPAGFFREGTIIEIVGAPLKVDNGKFRVESPFPFQPRGRSAHQWRRIRKNGSLAGSCNAGLRGGHAERVWRMLGNGTMRIVALEPAK